MHFPMSSSEVAALLSVPDHAVRNQATLNRVRPKFIMGRRAWFAEDVLKIARILGKDSPEVRNLCKAGGAE